MGIQVLFAIAAGLLWTPSSRASNVADCFDFAREIKEGPAHRKNVHVAGGSKASGELPSGVVWAAVRDLAPKHIQEILAELASHEKTKSSRIDEMEIDELADPRFLKHQRVKFEVDPFPLISVKW